MENMECKNTLVQRGAFDDVSRFLYAFVPPLSRIYVVYDDEKMKERVCSSLKKDYRLEFGKYAEDTKLVLAVGSERAVFVARKISESAKVPLVVAAPPWSGSLFGTSGLIFDTDYDLGDDIASLYGSAVSLLTTYFDMYVDRLLFGGEQINEYMDFAEQLVCQRNIDCEQIIDAALKAEQMRGAAVTSESVTASAYLELNNNRFTHGEMRIIFGAVLTSVFARHLKHRPSFTPPPDYNRRREEIYRLFGRTVGVYPQLKISESIVLEYKLRRMRNELIDVLSVCHEYYGKAMETLKRLYGDGGYCLRELSPSDFGLCISLSTDMWPCKGLLHTLKILGELDCYII